MATNEACDVCPAAEEGVRQLAERVEIVAFHEAWYAQPGPDMNAAEDMVRQNHTITPEDIDRLRPEVEADIGLSVGGCFPKAITTGELDKKMLEALTPEQKIALAGCATRQLRRTCWRTGGRPPEQNIARAEQPNPLFYPAGWQEIMEAPDAVDYQMMLSDLVDESHARLAETDQQLSREEILLRWQRAIEVAVLLTTPKVEIAELTEAEIVETGLFAFRATVIEPRGWEEEFLSFTVLDGYAGAGREIDIRDPNTLQIENPA